MSKNIECLQIAHGGGVDKYGNMKYNNVTREQLLYSINNGFKLIEIDLSYVDNNVKVVHDKDCRELIKFEDIIHIAVDNNVKFILDIKGNKIEFQKMLKLIDNYLEKYDAYKNFIIQVYNYSDIEYLSTLNSFKNVLIANWKNSPSEYEINNIIEHCIKYKINIVGTSLWDEETRFYNIHIEDKYKYYRKKGIQLYVHGDGCDDIINVKKYLSRDIGIFSKLHFINNI